jgi:hypothetical protein
MKGTAGTMPNATCPIPSHPIDFQRRWNSEANFNVEMTLTLRATERCLVIFMDSSHKLLFESKNNICHHLRMYINIL